MISPNGTSKAPIVLGAGQGVTQHYKERSTTAVPLVDCVPLLPVRYAISRDALGPHNPVKAPKVISPCVNPSIDIGKHAHYTLRLLREGYLYVYSEIDKGWRIYQLGSDGCKFLYGYRLPHSNPKAPLSGSMSAPDPDKFRMFCDSDTLQHPTPDGFIRVLPDQVIWLGFSDVKWTQKTLDEHSKEEVRKKHMRRFDPKTWNGHPHMAPIDEAEDRVAEIVPRIQRNAFDFSTATFRPRLSKGLDFYIPSWEKQSAVLMALDDPAGVAMDLASLMAALAHEWANMRDPDYKSGVDCQGSKWDASPSRTLGWTMHSDSGIDLLRKAVGESAATEQYQNFLMVENGWRDGDSKLDMDEFLVFLERPDQKGRKEDYDRQAETARQDALADFDKKYALDCNDSARQQWKTANAKRAGDFNQKVIEPLAWAHVNWCESESFRNYFNYVFDKEFDPVDAQNGLRFTETMARCYADVQDKGICSSHIEKWLNDEFKDPDHNLIVRAILCNHDETLKLITSGEARKFYITPRKFIWKDAIKGFNKNVSNTDKLLKADKAPRDVATARFTQNIMGPLGKASASAAEKGELTPGIVAAGVASETAIVDIEVGNICPGLMKEIRMAVQEHYPDLTVKQVKSAARQQVKTWQEAGALPEASAAEGETCRYLVRVDPDLAPNLPKKCFFNTRGKLIWAKDGYKELEADLVSSGAITAPKFKDDMKVPGLASENPGELAVEKASGATPKIPERAGGISLTCGIVGSVLGFMACIEVMDKAQNAKGIEKIRNNQKKLPQIIAAVGAFAQTGGQFITRLKSFQAGAGVPTLSEGILRYGGGAAVVLGGLLIAGCDKQLGKDAKRLGEEGLGNLYYLSAGVGYAVAGITLASMIKVIGTALAAELNIFFVVIGFGLSYAIDAKKSALIDNWLKKCSWGIYAFGDRYLKLPDEVSGLTAAVGFR